LVVSEIKISGAKLVPVVTPQGSDVEWMNKPADGSVALRLKLGRVAEIISVQCWRR
jgi:hypothetical protein